MYLHRSASHVPLLVTPFSLAKCLVAYTHFEEYLVAYYNKLKGSRCKNFPYVFF